MTVTRRLAFTIDKNVRVTQRNGAKPYGQYPRGYIRVKGKIVSGWFTDAAFFPQGKNAALANELRA